MTNEPLYKMENEGVYGVVTLSKGHFDDIPREFLISHSSDRVKFMCANAQERHFLQSIGVVITTCDWFKVYWSPSE